MAESWTPDALQRIGRADELEITTARADTLGAWLPIWAVVVGEDVYVRTWHRRETGWFGRAIATQWARVRVPGVESAVEVADIGGIDPELRAIIDAAYAEKYARYGATTLAQMTNDEAAAATLRLTPRSADDS